MENIVLTVQCDFDDTITVGNVGVNLRNAFGPKKRTSIEKAYLAGKLSVEESNKKLYALMKISKAEIEHFVCKEVIVRDGFNKFVEYCQERQVKLVIVSSGLDLYIRPTLDQVGLNHLEFYSGRAQPTPNGIIVEYANSSGIPITRGFKESHLRQFKAMGDTVIYIGDGRSDIVPASEADFVIARSNLANHLRGVSIPHFSFETFVDVTRKVEEILERTHI